jgi:hypothetical protein
MISLIVHYLEQPVEFVQNRSRCGVLLSRPLCWKSRSAQCVTASCACRLRQLHNIPRKLRWSVIFSILQLLVVSSLPF